MKSNFKAFKGKPKSAAGSGTCQQQMNKKQAKRNADTLIDNAVALQKKIDAEDLDSAGRNEELFNNAYNLFKKALDTYPNHAEALYGLGVLTLEKLDYDMSVLGLNNADIIRREVLSALSFFETVITNDTSRRGDTTGLAHRSCANALLQHFQILNHWSPEGGSNTASSKSTIALSPPSSSLSSSPPLSFLSDSVDQAALIRYYLPSFTAYLDRSRSHFNEVCTVLASSVALDIHVVEYCTYLQDALRVFDNVTVGNAGCRGVGGSGRGAIGAGASGGVYRSKDWCLLRIQYSNYMSDLLTKVALQSQFSNNQDRIILMLEAESYAECLEYYFELSHEDQQQLLLAQRQQEQQPTQGGGDIFAELYAKSQKCFTNIMNMVILPMVSSDNNVTDLNCAVIPTSSSSLPSSSSLSVFSTASAPMNAADMRNPSRNNDSNMSSLADATSVVASVRRHQHCPRVSLSADEVDLLANAASLQRNLIKLQVQIHMQMHIHAHAQHSTPNGSFLQRNAMVPIIHSVLEACIDLMDAHYAVCFNRDTAGAFGDFADTLCDCVGFIHTLAGNSTTNNNASSINIAISNTSRTAVNMNGTGSYSDSSDNNTCSSDAVTFFAEYISDRLFPAIHGPNAILPTVSTNDSSSSDFGGNSCSNHSMSQSLMLMLFIAKYLYCRAVLLDPPDDSASNSNSSSNSSNSNSGSVRLCQYCREYMTAVTPNGNIPPQMSESSECDPDNERDKLAHLYNIATVCFRLGEMDQCMFLLQTYINLTIACTLYICSGRSHSNVSVSVSNEDIRDIMDQIHTEILTDSDFQGVNIQPWFEHMFTFKNT